MDVFHHLSAANAFAWSRERVSVFFTFYLFSALVAGLFLFAALGFFAKFVPLIGLRNLVGASQQFTALIGASIFLIITFIILLLAFIILSILLSATFIKTAQEFFEEKNAKPSLAQCFNHALNRFLPLVATIVLIALVVFVVSTPLLLLSFVPLLGLFFAIVRVFVNILLALSFLFAQYFVILRGMDPVNSLVKSIQLFVRKPVEVFLAFIVSIVAAAFIIIISVIPLAVVVLFGLALFLASVKGGAFIVLILLFAIAVILFLLGLAFMQVFLIGFLTSVFLDLSGGEKIVSAPTPAPTPAPTLKPVKPVRVKKALKKTVKTRRA